jgi:poly-gamma-glutamate capsule biosynthesis protein CapA/YwtB (metallophosphatase superfamily)
LAALALAAVIIIQPKPAAAPDNPIPIKKTSKPLTTIFFAGDIMLSRNVARAMYKANDFNLPFAKVADEIKKASIAFANLESPFSDQGQHFVEGSLIFNADPKSAEGLKSAGFDILSTANNHTLDQDQAGLKFTYNLLSQNGIAPIGTTLDCHNGKILAAGGMKFGFLAYTYGLNGKGPTQDVCDTTDLKQVAADITKLKTQVDQVIVNMHAGTEYTRNPTPAQIAFAHAAIDAGADLVVGEHPHWVQTVEQYKGKWIFYSLGNLVFDQMWSQETREGLTLLVTYNKTEIQKIELRPVIIDDYCCPRWATDDETKNILAKINLTSPILFPHN